ncbi:DUF4179 domain-containing protein [Gracilibacillus oryzae]|uniref:DUF4179 domain-containing protein n=1 Tax=Gracilibacillus oryzae TaxID=1672701 RepID=A0A7C8GUB3_9BACI|nr:DUF4179 domain-containing protein [Gracilibacillus oryzae]KAB8138072.1 DUF4179 domain-containing protein [Gracilibacillus oryzae]
MNNLSDIFKKHVKKDDHHIPEEDDMWNKILIKQQKKERSSKKLKVAIPAIIFAIVLTSTPVIAAYSSEIMDWMHKVNRPGVITSLENGFGQEINQTSENDLGTLTVHNVVTDRNGTTINFSLEKEHSQDVSAAQFDQATLVNPDGSETTLEATAVYEESAGKIVGFLHTEKEIQADESVTLNLSGLQEFEIKKIDLSDDQVVNMTSIPIKKDGISQINILNNDHSNGIYQLHYLIELDELNETDFANLNFQLNGETVESSRVVYKRPEPNVIKIGESLQIAQDKINELDLSLEYQDTLAYHPASWSVDFVYNHDLAQKSTFVMDVDEEVELGSRLLQFTELAITLTEARLYYDEEKIISKEVFVNYNTMKLQIGDQEWDGYFSGEDYLTFETESVLNDIDEQSISLALEDAKVSYEGSEQDKVLLENISNEPKTVETKVNGYPVEFTYYLDGSSLTVESRSEDNRFALISQSVIYEGDKRIFADSRSNDGLNGSNKQVETFTDINEQDLTLHVFLYSIYEDRSEIVKLK